LHDKSGQPDQGECLRIQPQSGFHENDYMTISSRAKRTLSECEMKW
jgi:hypothetical protein